MMEVITAKGHQRASMLAIAACNIGSLAVAANLVLTLNPEDRISIKRGLALTALGFAYFTSLFELFNAAALTTGAGTRLRHKYRLSCGEVLDISNKVVSAVQAALSVLTGAVVVLYSCPRDFLRTSHYASEAYAWFGTSYFFYDIWSMYLVHVQMCIGGDYKKAASKAPPKGPAGEGPKAGQGGSPGGAPPARGQPSRVSFLQYCRHEPVILMHHLFIGGFGFLVIVYFRGDLGDCTFGFCYLMELSTPFVSLRGALARLRLKNTRLYVVNGLLMLASFFVCRVLSLPYVCLLHARAVNMPYLEAIKSLPTGCKVSICILLLPQLYWFYLMSAGAIKMLIGGQKQTADASVSAAASAPAAACKRS
ncbi:hypothetical protein evm_006224 [Chilo suppressalis]|nr:hypothetical protein evm_006224 [Chilo suppressalis]